MDLPAKQQAPVYLWVYSGVVSPHSPSVCVSVWEPANCRLRPLHLLKKPTSPSELVNKPGAINRH